MFMTFADGFISVYFPDHTGERGEVFHRNRGEQSNERAQEWSILLPMRTLAASLLVFIPHVKSFQALGILVPEKGR